MDVVQLIGPHRTLYRSNTQNRISLIVVFLAAVTMHLKKQLYKAQNPKN
jgi:hypothetical protein